MIVTRGSGVREHLSDPDLEINPTTLRGNHIHYETIVGRVEKLRSYSYRITSVVYFLRLFSPKQTYSSNRMKNHKLSS